jgi:hypothetical protein
MKAKIRHMVVFNLKYPKDSPQAKQFLEDAKRILSAIPYVEDYMQCYQISPKSKFDYALSLDFMTAEDYEKYSVDPIHMQYVEERWLKEVTDVLEIDFEEI